MKVIAIVGMAGSGKSEVARVFEDKGFIRLRFGDITEEEIRKRGLEVNEVNERFIRELLRKEHGMAAYAVLNQPRIDKALQSADVALDGLYSWEEYLNIKSMYGSDFTVVAVWSSPATRYARLIRRASRRLTTEEAITRDKSEIENLNKGGPIALADYTINNETSINDLKKQSEYIISKIKANKDIKQND